MDLPLNLSNEYSRPRLFYCCQLPLSPLESVARERISNGKIAKNMPMIAVPCNICGHDDWRLRFPATVRNGENPDVDAFRCTCDGYGSHPQIVQCLDCGYVYANPRWEPDELMVAYEAVEDATYLEERAGRERTFRQHLIDLEKIIANPGPAGKQKFAGSNGSRRLLDVGAYIGVFVEVSLARGWDAIGVEPSYWAAGVAQDRGLPIITGTLDAAELAQRRFEVITMWDVIEHLDDPSAELAKAYRLLEPGGIIAIHTMDIDSFLARLMGRRWPWLMDMHIHYFSRRTLIRLLEKQGYKVLWVGAQGRYLSLRYLVSRVGGMSRLIGHWLGKIVDRSGRGEHTLPVNFGDLFTVVAQRPS